MLRYTRVPDQYKHNTTTKGGQNIKDLTHRQNCVKRLMHSIKYKNVDIPDICYNLNSKFNDLTINAKISVLSSITFIVGFPPP